MCLITRLPKPLVAETPVKIYKVARKKWGFYTAPCRGGLLREEPYELFQYIPASEYTSITGGYIHCYTNYYAAKASIGTYPGFIEDFRIFEGYIPEGTEYWPDQEVCHVAAEKIVLRVPWHQRLLMNIRDWIERH